jgi:hypothetical protein
MSATAAVARAALIERAAIICHRRQRTPPLPLPPCTQPTTLIIHLVTAATHFYTFYWRELVDFAGAQSQLNTALFQKKLELRTLWHRISHSRAFFM